MSDIAQRLASAMIAAKKIGTQNGSAPPQSGDNQFPLVYEALVASRLKAYAEARYEQAKTALRDNKIIDEDYAPGDYTPYTGDSLAVTVKRNKDSETLDRAMLKNRLMKELNWSSEGADGFIRACCKPRKGNTTITVGMV